MRRLITYLLLITGFLTIIIGILEAQPRHNGPPVAHIIMATLFILTCIVHITINRKAVVKYLKGKE